MQNFDKQQSKKLSSIFNNWLVQFTLAQNRLYYRDQTANSLMKLVELVHQYKPTKIIELGTLSGLSLRTWLLSSDSIHVTAIDLSFSALHQSGEIIPLDLSRVTLLEQDILTIDFRKLWSKEDRVLVYVDAHDCANVSIMDHVLINAVPNLPKGSIVVVDDLWYSPQRLKENNTKTFFQQTVIHEIDPLQCFEGWYSSYWKGGSFFGFREVIPLMEWVNLQQIELSFQPDIKSVMFIIPDKEALRKYKQVENKQKANNMEGSIRYNPVNTLFLNHPSSITANHQINLLLDVAIQKFAENRFKASLDNFTQIIEMNPSLQGMYYAKAICLAKVGQLKAALGCLKEELSQTDPYPLATEFLSDLKERLKKGSYVNQSSQIGKKIDLPKVTIFAVPKPFSDHNDIIQRNAIKSWTLLQPKPEILLIGDDQGVADIAKEFGIKHIQHIEKNNLGTPLVNSIFETTRVNLKSDIMVYINADIILTNDFIKAIQCADQKFDKFLMVGQRWDTEVHKMIDFHDNHWEERLNQFIEEHGLLHSPAGIDYFIFKGEVWPEIPPFALGRTYWDLWLLSQPYQNGIDVINATDVIEAIHQNHDYGHLPGGMKEAWEGVEAQQNRSLITGDRDFINISETNWLLTSNGIIPNPIEGLPLRTVKNEVESLLKKISSRPIYIWGAGSGGTKMLSFLKSMCFNANGFIDKNPDRVGTDIQGVKVFSQDILNPVEGNLRPYIVIGTMFIDDVEQQLLMKGYQKYSDFLPGDLSKVILIKVV